MADGIPKRALGRTGEQVSILGLGGAHAGRIGQKDRSEAKRLMHAAIDGGITFFDNAWDYHDGWGEEMMGIGLEGGYRNRVFLMTKNCAPDYEGSRKCLEDSLRRLKTGWIDLWQFHEMNYDNDPDWVFEKGGMKYALEAQKAGKVRFIGFTGHKDPSIHLDGRILQKLPERSGSRMRQQRRGSDRDEEPRRRPNRGADSGENGDYGRAMRAIRTEPASEHPRAGIHVDRAVGAGSSDRTRVHALIGGGNGGDTRASETRSRRRTS